MENFRYRARGRKRDGHAATGADVDVPATKRSRAELGHVKVEYDDVRGGEGAGMTVPPSKPDPRLPTHWREHYDNIKTMREGRNAPVDTMGCEALADPDAEPKVQRYQTLVALMLSSQTKV